MIMTLVLDPEQSVGCLKGVAERLDACAETLSPNARRLSYQMIARILESWDKFYLLHRSSA